MMLVIQDIPSPLCLISANGRILSTNPSFNERVTGRGHIEDAIQVENIIDFSPRLQLTDAELLQTLNGKYLGKRASNSKHVASGEEVFDCSFHTLNYDAFILVALSPVAPDTMSHEVLINARFMPFHIY